MKINKIEQYSKLTNPDTPEAAYVLGFLFADGYSDDFRVALEITQDDFVEIEPLLDSLAEWSKSHRQRPNRRPQGSATISSMELSKFFEQLDFKSKSEVAPRKMLSIIPDQLKRYFWLGLIDGDGCFYINERNNCRQFCIASTYEQDWSCAEELLNSLNIKHKINRISLIRRGKENKSSIIRLCNKADIAKLYEYLYPNGYEFGLRRKFDKARAIWQSQQDDPVTRRYEIVNGKRVVV